VAEVMRDTYSSGHSVCVLMRLRDHVGLAVIVGPEGSGIVPTASDEQPLAIGRICEIGQAWRLSRSAWI